MSKRWFEEGYEPEGRGPIGRNDLQRMFDCAKDHSFDPKEILAGEGFAEQARQVADELGITIPIGVAHPPKLWDINEYKAQPFKDATIGEYWYTFERKTRREIERLVRKGKNPDIMKYI